jgi:DNA-3-methyladenine glycosylase II
METAIRHLRAADPVLAKIIEQVGPYEIRYRPPEFSTLVRSIVSQQVSTRAAATVYRRLRIACGRVNAAAIVRLTPEELRAVGLSGQKSRYIRDLAERTLRRELRFPKLKSMPDDEVIEHLVQVKGIGVWTAHMFLMFALRRPDVLPVGDLGIQAAIRRAYGLEAMPKPAEVASIGERWRPYASVASWYLWRSIDGTAEI